MHETARSPRTISCSAFGRRLQNENNFAATGSILSLIFPKRHASNSGNVRSNDEPLPATLSEKRPGGHASLCLSGISSLTAGFRLEFQTLQNEQPGTKTGKHIPYRKRFWDLFGRTPAFKRFSDFTSVNKRIEDRASAADAARPDARDVSNEPREKADRLAPIALDPVALDPVALDPPRKKFTTRRDSNKGSRSMSLDQSLKRLNRRERQIPKNKVGAILKECGPILERLACSAKTWVALLLCTNGN